MRATILALAILYAASAGRGHRECERCVEPCLEKCNYWDSNKQAFVYAKLCVRECNAKCKDACRASTERAP